MHKYLNWRVLDLLIFITEPVHLLNVLQVSTLQPSGATILILQHLRQSGDGDLTFIFGGNCLRWIQTIIGTVKLRSCNT